MKKSLPILILIILIITIGLVACRQSPVKVPDTTFWNEPGDGTITTNDYEKLQKKIPFKLVFPEYLPDDLVEAEVIFYYTVVELASDYDSVSITYMTTESKGWVEISEQKDPVEYDTSFDEIYNIKLNRIITLSGVDVLEQGTEKTGNEFWYSWIYEGMMFDSYIQGYTQQEARDVIKSMIN